MIRVNGKFYEYFMKYDLSNNHFIIIAEKIHHKFKTTFFTGQGKYESLLKVLSGTYRPSIYYKWVDVPHDSTNRFLTPEAFQFIMKVFDPEDYGIIRFNDKNRDITDAFKRITSMDILRDFTTDASKKKVIDDYMRIKAISQ
jgi:hypothetical protein